MNIVRGTTPQLTFTCNVSPKDFTICHIAFYQAGTVIFIKTLDDCTISDNDLILTLTELDTLKLIAGNKVKIQLRVGYADGTRDASNIIETTADKILEDGVLGEITSGV